MLDFPDFLPSTTGGAGASSLVVALPSWSPGDVIYIGISNSNINATGHAAVGGGWDLLLGDIESSGVNLAVLRRVMQAGDSDPTISWTGGNSRASAGAVIARGADQATPEDATPVPAFYTTNVATIDAPSITTTQAGCGLLTFYGVGNTRTGTPPGTQTELIDTISGANSPTLIINRDTNLLASAGATGVRTESINTVATARVAATVAVRPAAAVVGFEGWGIPL